MKTSTITSKDLTKMAYQSNRLMIQGLTKQSEIEYNHNQYQIGMKFLYELFTEDSEWIKIYERDKFFWNWWRSEWDLWQSKLVRYYRIERIKPSLESWLREMEVLAYDGETEYGFQNYLKTIKNVNISKINSRRDSARTGKTESVC